jgi:hypothetical protein
MYQIPGSYLNSNINHTYLLSYYLGYDPFAPEKARVYFNKPYFDPDITKSDIENSIGKVIYVNRNFYVFQFMANKPNKEPVIARQVLPATDIKRKAVKPGMSFKVEYLKRVPECAILYLDSIASDAALIDYKKPFLSKPNGIACDFEVNSLFTNPHDINQYLGTYNQPYLKPAVPLFMFNVNRFYKSGVWFGAGLGGNSKIFTGKFSLGYMQQINRRLYVNFSASLAGLTYTTKSFANNQLKTISDTSEFYYADWYFNPKIDLMWRITKNNVWGCRFIKLGVGMYYNLNPDEKWEYDIGRLTTNSKGQKSVSYEYASDLNTMPPLSRCMFYISLSFSFNSFKKQ